MLKFFDEIPSFGDHCGTCDLCLQRTYTDFERDFQWEGARVVLMATMACPNQVGSVVTVLVLKVDARGMLGPHQHNSFFHPPSP